MVDISTDDLREALDPLDEQYRYGDTYIPVPYGVFRKQLRVLGPRYSAMASRGEKVSDQILSQGIEYFSSLGWELSEKNHPREKVFRRK